MNNQEALDFILGFTNYEVVSDLYSPQAIDLRRMRTLLRLMGNPHRAARSIHIAGTKGKGSIAAMIASVLRAAGYSVGLFTSPHLHDFRERIQVNGEPISREDLALRVSEYQPLIWQVHQGPLGPITTFEVTAAIAFAHFAHQGVTFQVLETGLGGRLDATNVVQPLVSVLTPISLDHTNVLGDTLARITREKGGIIKRGVTAVSAPQPVEAEKVIRGICRRKRAPLISVGSEARWQRRSADKKGQSFHLWGRTAEFDLRIPLLGEYQIENAAAAVSAIEVLAEAGFSIPLDAVSQGLQRVRWPGRMEIIRYDPLIVVDGAHNVYSARKLREAIEKDFPHGRLILVVGISSDKDLDGIADELAPLNPTVIVTRAAHPRASSPSALAASFRRHGLEVIEAVDVALAMIEAASIAQKEDLILVTGSLFVAAEAIQWARGDHGRP